MGKTKGNAAPGKVASATSKSKRIAEADGRPAVEAWLDHVNPGQQALVRRLDRLILQAMPDAVCAVKFRRPAAPLGVPFYGLPGQGWIASVNAFKAHVKLQLFGGSGLEPLPGKPGMHGRDIDFHSAEELDEKQLGAWLQQARRLPGWGRL